MCVQVQQNSLDVGNSWRMQNSCPPLQANPPHPCTVHKYRVPWAESACSIMNTPAFQACHSLVMLLRPSILSVIVGIMIFMSDKYVQNIIYFEYISQHTGASQTIY